jgi:tetratricopeptide (TPR) repeat protein
VREGTPRPWTLGALLILLAFALYGNTLGHLYALDDGIVITSNVYTKQGLRGIPDIFRHDTFYGCFQAEKNLVSGGRYRPLSLATFAVEYQLAGANPHLSHAVNVLLYGLTGLLLYLLLRRLLGDAGRQEGWSSVSFLAALLFMTHPLHTEVVANVKGRDEILALLFTLVSFLGCLRYRDGGRGRIAALIIAGVSFFLAALAKESALPFLAIIPLGLWFFRPAKPGRLAAVVAVLLVPAAAYLALRSAFAGPAAVLKTAEILNDPFIGATTAQRLATVSKTFGIYLRLFLLPHPLTHDYYFNQVPIVDLGSPSALLPLAIALSLAAVALAGVRARRPVAFALLFFGFSFSIVSNLFFAVGTTLAERFLYVPTVGLTLALVFALRALLQKAAGPKGPQAAGILVLCASAVFSVLTVARNPAWKDNLTLFTTDVNTSPRSAKLQTAVASVLVDSAATQPDSTVRQQMLRAAVAHAEQALQIYPQHSLAWILLGNLRMQLGKEPVREALECYRKAGEYQPEMTTAFRNAAVAETRLGDYRAALADLRRLRALGGMDADAALLEAEALQAFGAPDSALAVLEEALRTRPQESRVLGQIGMIFGRHRRDYATAIRYLSRAVALAPDDRSNHENLGVAQALGGRPQDALRTFRLVLARFGGSPALYANFGLAWQTLGVADSARVYHGMAREPARSGR